MSGVIAPTRAQLEAALATSPEALRRLVLSVVEETDNYQALPLAYREVHAVAFLYGVVGRYGDDLEPFFRRYAALPLTLSMTLSGLERIGASHHRALLLEGAQLMVHHVPELAPVLEELGLEPGEAVKTWFLPSRWADSPSLEVLLDWHLAAFLGTFVMEPGPEPAPLGLAPPLCLVRNPDRAELLEALRARFGASLEDATPLDDLPPDLLEAILVSLQVHLVDLYSDGEPYTILHVFSAAYDCGDPWALHP